MLTYLAHRLVLAAITTFAITVVTFIILHLPPVDFVTAYAAQMSASGSALSPAEADAMRQAYGLNQPLYVQYWKWLSMVASGNFCRSFEYGRPVTEATVKVRVGGQVMHTASEGDGPVNALDGALRKALLPIYPRLAELHLEDYKVRVVNARAETAARVRVVVEWRDGEAVWGTVGVSENIIDASWQALADAIEYKLFRDEENA